jgi:hypothetical protein
MAVRPFCFFRFINFCFYNKNFTGTISDDKITAFFREKLHIVCRVLLFFLLKAKLIVYLHDEPELFPGFYFESDAEKTTDTDYE